MKILETKGKNGGHPLRLDDVEFMQDGTIESILPIYDFFKPSGEDAVYLKKPTFSFDGSGNYWHTEGILYWNGEVFYISQRLEADKVPVAYKFVIVKNFTPVLGVIYRAGNTEFVRADRIMALADVSLLNVGEYLDIDLMAIDDVFKDKITKGLSKSINSSTTENGKWVKIYELDIEADNESKRLTFDIYSKGTDTAIPRKGTFNVHVKYNGTLPFDPFDDVDRGTISIVGENTTGFDFQHVVGILESDTTTKKTIGIYAKFTSDNEVLYTQTKAVIGTIRELNESAAVSPLPTGTKYDWVHIEDTGFVKMDAGDAVSSELFPLEYKVVNKKLKLKGTCIMTGTGFNLNLPITGIGTAPNLGVGKPVVYADSSSFTSFTSGLIRLTGGLNSITIQALRFDTPNAEPPAGRILVLNGLEFDLD